MPVVGQQHADDVSAVVDVVKTGGLFDHPMFDASQDASFDGLGRLRGLLLCDAERRTQHRVLPPPGERWSGPVATHANGRLQVCASAGAERARDPAWTAVV